MDEVGTPGEGTRRGMAGAIMRLPRILFPRFAPMNRGGDGSSQPKETGLQDVGTSRPPRFMGRIAKCLGYVRQPPAALQFIRSVAQRQIPTELSSG